MKDTSASLAKIASLLAALALGFVLALAMPSHAQTTSTPSSIAPGPGGMWILHQGRVMICRQPLVQTRQNVGRGSLPPSPECGEPVALP